MMERAGGIAFWRQISEELRGEIASGRWPTGARLPTEAQLAERFGVNRHTVRRAIAALAAEGLIRTDQGRGTFVEEAGRRLVYPIARRTRFSEIVGRQAREPAGRLVGHGREAASPWLAARLRLAAGAPLVRLETLHVADGVPISSATSWFPDARFPTLIEAYAETGSVTKALARNGLSDYSRASTRISARLAEAREIERLGLGPGASVLEVEAVNVDGDGVPIQLTRSGFAGERVEFIFETWP
jgi:GntR family phosphonate transport system transcriptional regulator